MGLVGRLGMIPVVVGVGLGFLMVRPSSAAAPIDDIAGGYAGKVKYKDQVIDPQEEDGGNGTVDVGFLVFQEGVYTEGTFVIRGQGEDPDEYLYGDGRAGNGKFWFEGSTEGIRVILFGSMKGAEGKRLLKGKGVYLTDGAYSDIKFTLKEGDSGIDK